MVAANDKGELSLCVLTLERTFKTGCWVKKNKVSEYCVFCDYTNTYLNYMELTSCVSIKKEHKYLKDTLSQPRLWNPEELEGKGNEDRFLFVNIYMSIFLS